jgi:hypothetical protein
MQQNVEPPRTYICRPYIRSWRNEWLVLLITWGYQPYGKSFCSTMTTHLTQNEKAYMDYSILIRHNVGDNGAVHWVTSLGYYPSLLRWCVVFCCVCCGGGGVRFDTLCTNASYSYMMWHCSRLLLSSSDVALRPLVRFNTIYRKLIKHDQIRGR